MIPATFCYVKPKTLREFFEYSKEEQAQILAGGTDVVVMLREQKMAPKILIDIKDLQELKGIRETANGVFIGAAQTIQSVVENRLIKQYPALLMGADSVGCYEIRQRATIGGNIANGSPSADTVPGLLVHDAALLLASSHNTREVSLASFLLAPGNVDLKQGEILVGIQLPKVSSYSNSVYLRRTRVKGMDLSGVSVAVCSEGYKEFKIAVGAVMPTVTRFRKAEYILNNGVFSEKLVDTALDCELASANPRKGSLRAGPEYKKDMVKVLVKKAIAHINKAESGETCE